MNFQIFIVQKMTSRKNLLQLISLIMLLIVNYGIFLQIPKPTKQNSLSLQMTDIITVTEVISKPQ